MSSGFVFARSCDEVLMGMFQVRFRQQTLFQGTSRCRCSCHNTDNEVSFLTQFW